MAIAELVMPKLGESIMEATILKWHKQVGDTVKQDETVLDIATDKVDSEVPSTAEGVITEILFNINDVVPIGTVIARIRTGQEASDNGAPETPAAPATVAENAAVEEEPVTEAAIAPVATEIAEAFYAAPEVQEVPYTPATVAEPVKAAVNRFYSPLVLNIANSEGIALSELERIPGSGNEGRVTKKDILQYVADKKAGKLPVYTPTTVADAVVPVTVVSQVNTTPAVAFTTAPAVAGSFTPVSSGKLSDPSLVALSGATEIVEMDRMRKLIAKHMVNSKQTSPHVTSFAEADVTHMVLWRQKVKDEFERREGTKLTFTPMFIECIANVIKRFPLINCSLEGDNIILKKDINIGMATALPTGNLIVPVIKGADQLNIVGLSKAVNNMADAARNNKLKPEDTQGGTFTLTNVGTFGSLMGTPIINQPQVAIMAVGAIKKRPMVIESPEGDTIGIRHMMYLSMSYDHRIVDGSIGAKFLSEVALEFEKWDLNKQWFQYL
ncbi:MAG: 2-oxo acid dehydrogenase subunit E2 [Chitinophagaceae bacterium]|nr:2-oxo acid dehydrogenase subunit E2 [Chitinophagaceae bacterium]MCA6454257.1 2-oxo acid dehydrogenase subunit E2 [Chitinophagaceae bacterium]MCA6455511.1 2-oxo acid dehydrogenase subunit E2 [Chitinophagaceae bacterium]MCA6460689.1 2-oxo acid dehydrogenase subunit E2 [Chitinophagaceae bacterium]MCA6464911.1 2-oxo acid dehydrogenase subunit E2 [Chitinophagaceae bacterium]